MGELRLNRKGLLQPDDQKTTGRDQYPYKPSEDVDNWLTRIASALVITDEADYEDLKEILFRVWQAGVETRLDMNY